MDRTTRRVFVGALVLLVAAGVGLALLGGGGGSPARPDVPTVDGVVIKVDSTGLASVSGFTLRSDDGLTLAFTLAGLRNGTIFPPGHLAEHQATSSRIRVWYVDAAAAAGTGTGTLDALWIEDAPAR